MDQMNDSLSNRAWIMLGEMKMFSLDENGIITLYDRITGNTMNLTKSQLDCLVQEYPKEMKIQSFGKKEKV